MSAKSFAATLGLAVVFVMATWGGEADAFQEGVHAAAYKRHVVRLFGPRWHLVLVRRRAVGEDQTFHSNESTWPETAE
jgi:hypothetical protein